MGANAQTSVPAFTAGQVLTAAQVTQINTGIPVFASSTERDAAFGGTGEKTLAEGQMAYLEDTNATQYYDGSSWAAVAGGKILQVVSTTKTDTFAVATIGDQAITGLSATITPTSATSTIYVVASVVHSSSVAFFSFLLLTRGGTAIALGDTAGTRTTVTGGYSMNTVSDSARVTNSILTTLDSPATTSSTTYGVSFRNTSGTVTQYLNRSSGDADDPARFRSSSTITVMEVSA
jgi:hypothetical protein